ncbi:platelet-derived growth factor D isoform X2 [Oryzias latipes]|uniref:Platelet-derived growth factor D n=1 Tax=Oryzias latipes TaxID=8090 RepID=A0A3B3HT84_ORYLA|nr:platelet-derived growth factor D isoform X2 [Oryzias latipes]
MVSAMKGSGLLQMWILFLLGAVSGVGRAQVSTARVLRGNTRRDDLYQKEENIVVTSAGGFIQSPRYPNAYPRNLLLSWKLLSAPGSRIHLEFDAQFGLEEPENGVCRYDFVEVEDQAETSTIIWGRWCGQNAPPSLKSKSNVLRVTFKSDDYFVAKPGFKIYYSLLIDRSLLTSKNNLEAVTSPMSHDVGVKEVPTPQTVVPLSLEDLDRTIASFDTVEQLLKSLSPSTWREDLDSIYTQTYVHYRSRSYYLAGRHDKVDLNRLYDDVKRYSCTPRNYSVNLREELRITNAVFFPRCLLVKRCGGNCGCGSKSWQFDCTCQPTKTATKLHEVLKYAPDPTLHKRPQSPRLRWVIDEIFLSHHDTCECVCPSQPPR